MLKLSKLRASVKDWRGRESTSVQGKHGPIEVVTILPGERDHLCDAIETLVRATVEIAENTSAPNYANVPRILGSYDILDDREPKP